MQAIEFKTQLKHGQITIPLSYHLNEGQSVRVLILLDDPIVSSKNTEENIWQKTAGAWQGEPLVREPQGNFEQRLELE